MSSWRLDSLLVENFRSISGRWAIPLDGDVILVHGPNGAGKTSLLSALELGATGAVGHLSGTGAEAQLVNRNYPLGGVELILRDGDKSRSGRVDVGPEGISGDGALLGKERIDFVERCFLPQTVLGRLLETYARQDAADSVLVRFVKELAGIDDLDSLIDGLNAAGHVARTRGLSAAWGELENASRSGEQRLAEAEAEVASLSQRAAGVLTSLRAIVVWQDATEDGNESLLSEARSVASDSETVDTKLADLESLQVRLEGIVLALSPLNAEEEDPELAATASATADKIAFETWELGVGAVALEALNEVRERLGRAAVPSSAVFESFNETHRMVLALAAEERAAEELRVRRKFEVDARQSELAMLSSAIKELETTQMDLAIAPDARILIDALRLVLPLLHDAACPVCDQTFPGGQTELAHHISQNIAGLSRDAERYGEVAAELDRARARSQQLLELDLGPEPAPPGPVVSSELIRELNRIQDTLAEGRRLLQALDSSQARLALMSARRSTIEAAEQGLKALLSEMGIERPDGSVLEATRAIRAELEQRQQDAQYAVTRAHRVQALLSDHDQVQQLTAVAEMKRDESKARLREDRARLAEGRRRKDAANALRLEAQRVRSAMISEIFDNALNQTWADFFTRLVPNEPFVPQFRQRIEASRAIDVALETVDPDGRRFGSPSSMLSFGNANTAALSLFLGLHVSAPAAVEWLIFDDPVQSMDDIHVANFAAVVRQMTMGHRRQVVIAVHQRELYDYLAFELAPARPTDRLIKIELERRGETSRVEWERVLHTPEHAIVSA